jgi:hypothetical protein
MASEASKLIAICKAKHQSEARQASRLAASLGRLQRAEKSTGRLPDREVADCIKENEALTRAEEQAAASFAALGEFITG